LHTSIKDAFTTGTANLDLNSATERPQKQIPWTLQLITLKVFIFLSTALLSSSLLTKDNQPKAFVVSISYHVVININISINRMAKSPEGNTGKDAGIENIRV
jgi:hypothetical protein